MLRLDPKKITLTLQEKQTFERMQKKAMSAILHATSLAYSGHPGGSLSSLDLLLVTYALSDISPENFSSANRDRVVVSHGHISPAVYTVLSQYGFFPEEEMILNFRKTGSKFAGHIEHTTKGIEWSTGNLGQGLSAACGMALAQKRQNINRKVFAFMGDGEQQKGQITEACRFAVKYKLNNLIAIIDVNRFQIGGATKEIMDQDLAGLYKALQWNVLEIKNGHDHEEIFSALQKAKQLENTEKPTLLLAHTFMGNTIPFMHDICDFHGKPCSDDEHNVALEHLNLPNRLDTLRSKKSQLPFKSSPPEKEEAFELKINRGEPIIYGTDVSTDNRSAYGAALADLGKLNNHTDLNTKLVGFSCDLEGSVKMSSFRKNSPEFFFEGGIQEHNTSVVAGALSKENFQVFFSTFGVFGVDEVYNQQRLNQFNETNLKTVCTHLGLSVGEDGPTHQNLDYIGLLKNIFDYKVFIPADPNQTDAMIRYVAGVYGNIFIGMGRAKTPIISNENNLPFFGKDYTFEPGKADVLRKGSDATIVSYGPLVVHALEAAEKLQTEEGLSVTVLNMGSVIPLDTQAIIQAAQKTKVIVSLEDHHVDTGVGSMIGNVLAQNKLAISFKPLGVDRFSSSGESSELYKDHGLDTDSVVKTLLDLRKSI
ncbi:transketolase [PVC group bacterium (ex Bugula neritina AB1)]|nr:transketolase [PVC group bacterium (ex Bugula neritina AB1)]